VLQRNGRLGEARVLLDELMAEAGDEAQAPDRAVARALEAGMDLEAGQPAAALLLARQAIASLPVPPYGDERARAWLLAVRSLHALGRVDEGATELAAFAGAITAEDSPDARLFATIARAEQAVAEHRADAARALYEEALAAAQRRGVPAMLSETAGSYGRFLLGQGDLPQAASVIGLAARYAERDFASAVLQVQLYRALGRREAAEAAAAQARKLAGERAIPPDPSVSVPASAIRNSADIEPQQKRNRRGLVVPTGRG
jgi:tetratricopeptide (TPR) repeat protein